MGRRRTAGSSEYSGEKIKKPSRPGPKARSSFFFPLSRGAGPFASSWAPALRKDPRLAKSGEEYSVNFLDMSCPNVTATSMTKRQLHMRFAHENSRRNLAVEVSHPAPP